MRVANPVGFLAGDFGSSPRAGLWQVVACPARFSRLVFSPSLPRHWGRQIWPQHRRNGRPNTGPTDCPGPPVASGSSRPADSPWPWTRKRLPCPTSASSPPPAPTRPPPSRMTPGGSACPPPSCPLVCVSANASTVQSARRGGMVSWGRGWWSRDVGFSGPTFSESASPMRPARSLAATSASRPPPGPTD